HGDTTSAVANHEPFCGQPWAPAGMPDVYYRLDLASSASVAVTVKGADGPAGALGFIVALRPDCDGYEHADCRATATATDPSMDFRWGNLEAGSYVIELHTARPGAYSLWVTVDAPDSRPSNDRCIGAQVVPVPSGGATTRIGAPSYTTSDANGR